MVMGEFLKCALGLNIAQTEFNVKQNPFYSVILQIFIINLSFKLTYSCNLMYFLL